MIEVYYKGYDLEVHYTYIEGEERTWEYPGSPPEIEIEEVYLEGVDVMGLIEEIPNGLEELKQEIFNSL